MRGAATIARPAPHDFARRYAELLSENLGQPGYRELILSVHDLDSRRDLVFGLLADPWRRRFADRAAAAEAGSLIDLGGADRGHVVDALAAALSPPGVAEPHPVVFPPGTFWRGETHRLCDRPSAVTRLLREVLEAGARQVIVVAATPAASGPHALARPGAGPRDRIGEVLDALETAALDDALELAEGRFEAVFTVRLAHNPLGAFAFAGRRDERSDRRATVEELVERGYEEAYRQFVEPVLGAAGEPVIPSPARPSPEAARPPAASPAPGPRVSL
jgi:hypothetical protein